MERMNEKMQFLGCEYQLETITPELAREYLKHNMANNRKPKDKHIAIMAADMKNGRWEWNNVQNMIIFDKNGWLKDGQNRLMAIIKANAPVKMIVARNVPPEIHVYDKAAPRSTSDTLTIAGYDRNSVNVRVVSVVRFMNDCVYGGRRWSDSEVGEYISEYGGTILQAIGITHGGKHSGARIVNNASVQSALYVALRAGVDYMTAEKFIRVCQNGLQDNPMQTSAIILRNFVIDNKSTWGSRSGQYRIELFVMCLRALKDFCDGTPTKRKYRNLEIQDAPYLGTVKLQDSAIIQRIMT